MKSLKRFFKDIRYLLWTNWIIGYHFKKIDKYELQKDYFKAKKHLARVGFLIKKEERRNPNG